MMWMMGYNDGGSEFNNNIQDPITGRKLRPLMPRPATAAAAAAASTNPPNCIHCTDLRALNHHLAAMAEQNKRSSELNSQQVVVSSRWNPTPEQLQTLEELYRRGTRTPSADQIQHITAQLRRYGKIEGKNVFYWFQNHKARERQKRRRCLESLSDEQQQQNQNNSGEKRDSTGGNRTVYEVEQTKNWASPTNSSTIPTEKTLSTQEGATGTESKADGWTQMEEEFQLQRRNATWQMMNNLSSSSSSTAPHTVLTSGINQSTVISNPHHDFVHIISLEPYKYDPENLDPSSNGGESTAQTLELFPLHSTNQTLNEEEESGAAICGDSFTPYQFFEFLPLKN